MHKTQNQCHAAGGAGSVQQVALVILPASLSGCTEDVRACVVVWAGSLFHT